MPDDAKFNEEEMLHLFSVMLGADEKEAASAKAGKTPTIPAVTPPASPLAAKPERPTPMALPSAAKVAPPAPMVLPLAAKPARPTPMAARAPLAQKQPVKPPVAPPAVKSVKLPEAVMIPPPPPPPVAVHFDPSLLAAEEPAEPAPPPPPPPPPTKPSREQLTQVEELGHQFEIGRTRMQQLLVPFIGERVTKKMLAWSLEHVQKSHPILKNVHWSSQGELHGDGTIEVARLVKNVQNILGQNVVGLTKASMLDLLKARLAAVEQGLGVSLRQAVEKEVRRLEGTPRLRSAAAGVCAFVLLCAVSLAGCQYFFSSKSLLQEARDLEAAGKYAEAAAAYEKFFRRNPPGRKRWKRCRGRRP